MANQTTEPATLPKPQKADPANTVTTAPKPPTKPESPKNAGKKPDGRTTRLMSSEHKASLAAGRAMALAVRRYLELVAIPGGKPVSQESIEKRLDSIERNLATASSLKRLQLLQDREDAKSALAATADAEHRQDAEKEFIAAAKEYAERKRIGYRAWRAAGVSAEVLKKAGITRGS